MTISLGPVFGGPGFSPWATCRYFGVSDDKSDRLMRADLTGHNLEEFCGALGRWDGHMMVSRCVSMQKTRTKKVHLCWFNLYRFSSKGTTHSIVQYTTHALLDLIIYLNFLEFNAPFARPCRSWLKMFTLVVLQLMPRTSTSTGLLLGSPTTLMTQEKKLASLYGKLKEDRPTPIDS